MFSELIPKQLRNKTSGTEPGWTQRKFRVAYLQTCQPYETRKPKVLIFILRKAGALNKKLKTHSVKTKRQIFIHVVNLIAKQQLLNFNYYKYKTSYLTLLFSLELCMRFIYHR